MAPANVVRSPRCVRFGPRAPGRVRRERVAARAAVPGRGPDGSFTSRQRGRRLRLLRRDPLVVVGLRLSTNTFRRMFACERPQYSAHWPEYSPIVVARDRQVRRAAGNRVLLAREVRDPERVDDVGGGERQEDRRVDRDVHLVRGGEAGGLVGVVVLPPPLLPGDVDVDDVRSPSAPSRGRRSSRP